MLKIPPPTSSTERVRQFRERNPGYDRRFMARQRAMEKEGAARFLAEQIAAAQAVASSEPLMLPAPVEDPMMAQINGRGGKSEVRTQNSERIQEDVTAHLQIAGKVSLSSSAI